jgi:hypothetical protein
MCDPYLTYYAHTIDKRLHLRVGAFFIRTQHKSKSPGGLGEQLNQGSESAATWVA